MTAPVFAGRNSVTMHHTIESFGGSIRNLASLKPRVTRPNKIAVSAVAPDAAPSSPGDKPSKHAPQFKVPSSKELERMRQFRQQQQFKQQQVMRHMQRGLEKTQPSPPPPATAPQRGRTQPQHNGSPSSSSPSTRKPKTVRRRRSASPAEDDGLTPEEFRKLVSTCGLEESWRPQVGLLRQLGLRPSDLARLADARPEVFAIAPSTMRRKLAFLRDTVGLPVADLVKVVTKCPRILEYSSEQTLRPRLAFLREIGVPGCDVPKVVARAPMIMALSMQDTLEPRVAFLREELALPEGGLGKLIARHPQVLTCSQDSMRARVEFLLLECGLETADVARAVLAHPQVLHYKIDSMRERLEYLRSVGMNSTQIGGAVARFPQIFSLSVLTNMAPKWHYLVEHLGGGVETLCSYPGFFSLSLHNRIVPRHRYLQHLRGDESPMPFPLGHLKMADKLFALEVAGTPLAEYEAFKEQVIAQHAAAADAVAGTVDDNEADGTLHRESSSSSEDEQADSNDAWAMPASRQLPQSPGGIVNGSITGLRGGLNLGPNAQPRGPLIRRAHP